MTAASSDETPPGNMPGAQACRHADLGGGSVRARRDVEIEAEGWPAACAQLHQIASRNAWPGRQQTVEKMCTTSRLQPRVERPLRVIGGTRTNARAGARSRARTLGRFRLLGVSIEGGERERCRAGMGLHAQPLSAGAGEHTRALAWQRAVSARLVRKLRPPAAEAAAARRR